MSAPAGATSQTTISEGLGTVIGLSTLLQVIGPIPRLLLLSLPGPFFASFRFLRPIITPGVTVHHPWLKRQPKGRGKSLLAEFEEDRRRLHAREKALGNLQ